VSRKRYRYNTETKQVEEIGADWTDVDRRAPAATEELVYGNLGTAPDGTRIDTRKRHREYMKANNLALADDFKDTWAKAEQERKAFHSGQHKAEGLREQIGRALYNRKRK